MKLFDDREKYLFLKSGKIMQICIGRYMYSIIFEEGHFINSEYMIEYTSFMDNIHEHYDIKLSPYKLSFTELIGETVLDVRVIENGRCLSLFFNKQKQLDFLTMEGPYECGEIGSNLDSTIF